MKCPKCGFENRSHARFCKQCGQSLPAQASPPPPSAPTNLICLACGTPVKPGARFCPRCGRPLPTAPPPPPPAQPPAYTPLPAQPPPPAYAQSPVMHPPFTAPPAPQRHSPRWIWWVVGVAVSLCIIVVAAAVLCEPKIIGTEEEPAPAAVGIALSNTDLRVGETLTVTAIVTNTGSAPLGNLLYQLVGEQTPLEGMSEVWLEGDVLPGETNVVTFALQANQEGTATLQVYALMDVRTASPFKESLLSEMRTVSITSQ